MRVESPIDERVTIGVSAPGGCRWTQGKIFTPRFALSRANPGELAFATLTKLGIADCCTGEVIWSVDNTLGAHYGVPEKIVPYPDGRLWVTVGNEGAALVDAQGHVEPTDVASNNQEPVITPSAILFKGTRVWQPLPR
jgi:hypothetical protein